MAAAPAPPSSWKPPYLQRVSSTTGTLVIPSRVGQRRVLLDVFVAADSPGFTEIRVGNAVLARIYDNGDQARLISDVFHKHENRGFLGWLTSRFPDLPPFNASQDEDIIITRPGAVRIDAYYAIQEGGDVTSRNLLGGSQASTHLFVLNVTNSQTITASGRYRLDKVDMPEGLTVFTDGSNSMRMAPNIRFTVHVIAFEPFLYGDTKSTRVHIFDEFVELFTSENNEGLVVDPQVANDLAFALQPPMMFIVDPPYVFEPNRLLSFLVDVTHDGTNNISPGDLKLFLIGRRDFVG